MMNDWLIVIGWWIVWLDVCVYVCVNGIFSLGYFKQFPRLSLSLYPLCAAFWERGRCVKKIAKLGYYYMPCWCILSCHLICAHFEFQHWALKLFFFLNGNNNFFFLSFSCVFYFFIFFILFYFFFVLRFFFGEKFNEELWQTHQKTHLCYEHTLHPL